MDVAVEDVVADVGGGSFHTLDVYFSFGHVKVIVEELTRVFSLPEEIFGNVSPELCRRGGKGLEKDTRSDGIMKTFMNHIEDAEVQLRYICGVIQGSAMFI